MITQAAEIDQLLSFFPPVVFAFTYGSGAVEQGGYQYKKKPAELPMIDIILVVDNSEAWHAENMRRNPAHYSSLFPMSHSQVAFFQEKVPANLWFNAYIPIPSGPQAGRLLKYGVISKRHALKDLTSWNSLYIAGRLHKPVNIVQQHDAIESAMGVNKDQAIRTALLLLPEKFTEVDLFMAVASLSYVGDPRMIIGENPKKVRNLVSPILHHYRSDYKASFEKLGKQAEVTRLNSFNYNYQQDVSQTVRWSLCLELPSTLRSLLSIRGREKYLRCRPPKAATIRTALASIVARSSSMQTLKGLFTVGLLKSSSYLVAKMTKRFMAPVSA